MLFANDTLIFCGASQDQIVYLSWLLMSFEVISFIKINLEKRGLIPIGRVVNEKELAYELGCKVGEILSSSLGLPLGSPFKSVIVGDGVVERFHKRLSIWKRRA